MKYYLKILLNLLGCALIPCVIVILIAGSALNVVFQDTISSLPVNRLRAVANTSDILISMIEENALRFSTDPNIQQIGRHRVLDEAIRQASFPTNLTRVMRMTQELVRGNETFDSVYLYIADSDYLISSRNGVVRLNAFADLEWMEKYNELRINTNGGRMISARAVYAPYGVFEGFTDSNRRCVTYIFPITKFTTLFEGALVFNLYEDKLLELYTANAGNGGFAVFGKDGEMLTDAGITGYEDILNEYGQEAVFANSAPESGYFFSSVTGERLLCTWFRNADYTFFSMDNMSEWMNRQQSLQFSMLILLIILIPFAALVSFLISRRLYGPIAKLTRELQASGRWDLSGGNDEFSAISRTINELLREDSRLFNDKSREKLLDATVLRILAGEDDEEDEDARQILRFSKNVCLLVAPAFSAEDCAEENISRSDFDARMRLLSRHICDELSGEKAYAAGVRYENDLIAVILSIDESVEDAEAYLTERLSRVRGGDVMDCPVAYAAGSLTDDFASVRQSFDEARQALQYRFIKGLGGILFADRITPGGEFFDAAERIAYIRRCVEEGKKEDALTGIRALVAEIEAREWISFDNISQILNLLVGELMQYASVQGMRLEEPLKENALLYRGLWRNRTLSEAGEWLCDVFGAVIEYQHATQNEGGDYVRSAVEYVKANYANDITIDSIAAHIGISYSYLRKIFKDATGSNLVDYINSLRIQKAKELLRSTNYTVREIATLCGYNHERSFSRSFSQSEGISPGKYRGGVLPKDSE